jgi:hypothetical protein
MDIDTANSAHKLSRIFWIIREIIVEIFKASFLGYIFFYLLENLKEGLVTNYFNLNILLWTAFITAILSILFKNDDQTMVKVRLKIWDVILIVFFGLLIGLLVYQKLKEFGKLAFVVSPVASLVVILISLTLMTGEDENPTDKNN